MRAFVAVLLACLAVGTYAGPLKKQQLETEIRSLENLLKDFLAREAGNGPRMCTEGTIFPPECEGADPPCEKFCTCTEVVDADGNNRYEFQNAEGKRCEKPEREDQGKGSDSGSGGMSRKRSDSGSGGMSRNKPRMCKEGTIFPRECEGADPPCEEFCTCTEIVDADGNIRYEFQNFDGDRCEGNRPRMCEPDTIFPPECEGADPPCEKFCTCTEVVDADGNSRYEFQNPDGDRCEKPEREDQGDQGERRLAQLLRALDNLKQTKRKPGSSSSGGSSGGGKGKGGKPEFCIEVLAVDETKPAALIAPAKPPKDERVKRGGSFEDEPPFLDEILEHVIVMSLIKEHVQRLPNEEALAQMSAEEFFANVIIPVMEARLEGLERVDVDINGNLLECFNLFSRPNAENADDLVGLCRQPNDEGYRLVGLIQGGLFLDGSEEFAVGVHCEEDEEAAP